MERLPVSWRKLLLTRTQSFKQDSRRRRKRTRRKGDKQRSSNSPLHETPFWARNDSTKICRGREKVHHKSTWKPHQDAVYLIHFGQGTRTKDCSCSRQGLMPLSSTIQCEPTASKKWYASKEKKMVYQRVSTPRPAPKIFLKDVWKLKQQQQQQQDTLLSTGKTCNGAEPRHSNTHRETSCGGGESVQS